MPASPRVVSLSSINQEFAIIQQSIPDADNSGFSATEGLHLNITVPQGVTPNDRIPVIVFVHGGAFAFGCNNYPHYDGERLVTLSAEEGKPVICVTMKYVPGAPALLFPREPLTIS